MSKSYSLDKRLRVISPCLESWETMVGSDQVRFCSHCQKNVHNISNMTREQAIELAFESKGRLCVKYYRQADQSIKFVPSNESKSNNSSLMKFAAGLFFAVALTSTPAMAQNTVADTSLAIICQEEIKGQNPVLTNGSASFKGVVTDEQGAVIPGANVTLINNSNNGQRTTTSNEMGEFFFTSLLEEDNYTLQVEAEGFRKTTNEISFLSNSTMNLTIALSVSFEEGQMGIVVAVSPGEEMVGYYKERCKIKENAEEEIEFSEEIKNLFDAVRNNEIKEVKAKIRTGISLNVTNEEGEHLLSQAIASEKMVKLLLKAGVDVNARSRFLTTPLMYASVRENTRIAKLLINAGAAIDAVDINGRSALILAAADDNLEMVKLLLESGANPYIKDYEGKTALSYAKEYNHIAIKRLLKSIKIQK